MAGHSKFKNIMHRKGAQDKKRAGMFSKLSREITVAAKSGLPDPDMNPRLRAAINAAKALEPILGEAEGAKLAWRPQTSIDVGESDAATLIKLIDALDEDDDVQQVWGNYEVSDDVMERLG